jgi:hypothetical protein
MSDGAKGLRGTRARLHVALLVAGLLGYAVLLSGLWWARFDFLDFAEILRPATVVAPLVYAAATTIAVAGIGRAARSVVVVHALAWPACVAIAGVALLATGTIDVIARPVDAHRGAALAAATSLERWWIEPATPVLHVDVAMPDGAVELAAYGAGDRALVAGPLVDEAGADGRRGLAVPLLPTDDADRAALRIVLHVHRARAHATIEHGPAPARDPSSILRPLPAERRP